MKDEALKLALDDLIAEYHMETSSFASRVDEIFKQALAAPVQDVSLIDEGKTAAQRQWVGLAEADKDKPDIGAYVYLNDDWLDGYKTGMEYAEAKLKEKNT
jgi:hypothetical protein